MAKATKPAEKKQTEQPKSQARQNAAGKYEVVQEFSAWSGSEQTRYPIGPVDVSDMHPNKLGKYIDGGFIKEVASKEEAEK